MSGWEVKAYGLEKGSNVCKTPLSPAKAAPVKSCAPWKSPQPIYIFCREQLQLGCSLPQCLCGLSLLCLPMAPTAQFDISSKCSRGIFFCSCIIRTEFSTHKATYSTWAKRPLPFAGGCSPSRSSPRCCTWGGWEGIRQGNAKSRRMISHCPSQGTGLLSSSDNVRGKAA